MLTELIQEAQKKLINNPFDIYHEIGHHCRTIDLAQRITRVENLSVDSQVLLLSGWYHDIGKGTS